MSLTEAMNLVDNIENIGIRTDKVHLLSDFYKMVLPMTKAYPEIKQSGSVCSMRILTIQGKSCPNKGTHYCN